MQQTNNHNTAGKEQFDTCRVDISERIIDDEVDIMRATDVTTIHADKGKCMAEVNHI